MQDIDRKNEQTAAILKMQGAQLAELEALYKEEQVLRKRYFNTIEGGQQNVIIKKLFVRVSLLFQRHIQHWNSFLFRYERQDPSLLSAETS